MRNAISYTTFIIAIICFFSISANAQETNVEHALTFYTGWDGSVTTFSDPLDNMSYQQGSYTGFSFGLSFDFPSGIRPLMQVSVQEIKESLEDMVSNTQIWYFMGGLFLKEKEYPFHMTLLVGMNRHIYDFGNELDLLFVPVNNFAAEVEFGYEFFVVNNMPVRLSVGTKNPFNTGLVFDNMFVKIGTSFSVNLF